MEEQRVALAQLVERIEFDPATGEGRMHYRLGVNGTRFHVDTAAASLGLGKPGFKWRPHGEHQALYTSYVGRYPGLLYRPVRALPSLTARFMCSELRHGRTSCRAWGNSGEIDLYVLVLVNRRRPH